MNIHCSMTLRLGRLRWSSTWMLLLLIILMVHGCPNHDPQHTLCQYRPSACTGKTLIPRFPVGQNVATTWTFENPSPAGPSPEFRRQVEAWFGEVMQWRLTRSDVEHFHFSERTGHYTQLVWSDTYLVGCGYSYFKDPQRGYTKLYVCNYGPGGNVIGEHLYEPGQPTCTTGDLSTSRRYTGLCEVRGSNPPGMFCSANDALHATHGTYALPPAVPPSRPVPQPFFSQQPFQQHFHPPQTFQFKQQQNFLSFRQNAIQPYRPLNAVQPYRPFSTAVQTRG
ncbi:hypothetical protein B566_EDAN015289 [Ephemera danica]|nr:hypothetical protein B566_EDAN015289 [Ephemera danica]